jgi:DNA replication ATP-dependent helicase Dna2
MDRIELGRLFWIEVMKVVSIEGVDTYSKIKQLQIISNKIYITETEKTKIHFASSFSRISYVCHKHQIGDTLQHRIHHFNARVRESEKLKSNIGLCQKIYLLGIDISRESIEKIYGYVLESQYLDLLPKGESELPEVIKIKSKIDIATVVVVEDEPLKERFKAVDKNRGDGFVYIRYNITGRGEHFKQSIAVLKQVVHFPVTLNLLDVLVNHEGEYLPQVIVIEPDYLVDVTAVAEVYKPDRTDAWGYLLKKFLPYHSSPAIMVGNIANFFLDELIANPEVYFEDVFKKVFQLNPVGFCLFTDQEVREVHAASRKHFTNLHLMVKGGGFESEGIERENCFLEPSFYSAKHGLQGRLDVFYYNLQTQKAAIVELKSGKPFRPNQFGINHNHYVQTILYDLLIEATYKGALKPVNYILYSVLDVDNLKHAPETKAAQQDALNIRNQLLALEHSLINLTDKPLADARLFEKMTDRILKSANGFEKTSANLFKHTYQSLSSLEKKYFAAFASFIAREHQVAKTGVHGHDQINGVSSLWLDGLEEKNEQFSIFNYLTIADNRSAKEDGVLVFKKSDRTNPLANFRVGDIVVVYPAKTGESISELGKSDFDTHSVLENQIFKGSIVLLDLNHVHVRLRSRQLNQSLFETYSHWHLEPDLFDSSFGSLYRGLFDFASAPKEKRDLLMTVNPPSQPLLDFSINLPTTNYQLPTKLTEEQERILLKIVQSKDYFLLWGPPGTGKTSVMLRELVSYYLLHTDESVLLLAYTNRAVDEICEAIETIDGGEIHIKDTYFRIGSSTSTSPKFVGQLMDKKIENITNRAELKSVIGAHRIVVATLASMTGKIDLLKLKKFNRVIVDEASQILEPILAGLLPQFEHFTLIGDHKQLPAVVTQDVKFSGIDDVEMQTVGINNLRNSLFERLYKRCISQKWDWAYDILSHQGRMHQEIMDYPANRFYEGKLKVLPDTISKHQSVALTLAGFETELKDQTELDWHALSTRRIVFVDAKADIKQGSDKTNVHEAELVAKLVAGFMTLYKKSNKKWNPTKIGIITPYRAQIALIRKTLIENNIHSEEITIDTVERYQGGAKDIIIISLCVNNVRQLTSLVSLSDEGVDRKLNVALTRAKEHLVIIGNRPVLRHSDIYRDLIDFCIVEEL